MSNESTTYPVGLPFSRSCSSRNFFVSVFCDWTLFHFLTSPGNSSLGGSEHLPCEQCHRVHAGDLPVLARTSPVPVCAQGWVGAESDRRWWSFGGTSDAPGATAEWWEQLLLVALMIAAPLSTPIPSLAASLAFLGFDKDEMQPSGYPSYVFWTSRILSSPLILQKLTEAGLF